MTYTLHTTLTLAIALLLAGCGHKPYLPEIDAELLKKCQDVPELKGTQGATVMRWARQAGPIIADCHRTHNALVEVLKPLQRKEVVRQTVSEVTVSDK